MNIQIQSLHFDADIKLEDFIKEKLNKVLQYHDDVLLAEVVLRLDKSQDNENKIVEIKLDVPGTEVFSKKQSKSFEESADNAIEALRRQLKRHKEILEEREKNK